MIIHYATKNAGKFESLLRESQGTSLKVVQAALVLDEPRSDNTQFIAQRKVLQAYAKLKRPVIALDAGFYVTALNGFPRANVNFMLDTVGVNGLLKLAEGKKDRSCNFRECLAFMDAFLDSPESFICDIDGLLAPKRQGRVKEYHWSPLTAVFIPKGHEKTLAEMNRREYFAWSESCKGQLSPLKQLVGWLNNRLAYI